MKHLLTGSAIVLWLVLGFFFHSAWTMIWGTDIGSQTIFVLLWSSAFLSFIPTSKPNTELDRQEQLNTNWLKDINS